MTQLSAGDPAPLLDARPLFGLPVRTPGRGGGKGPLVVVFLRSLGGGNARAAVRALNAAYSRFDAEGVEVVGVTRSGLEVARDFVPRYHVLFPIVADLDGTITAAWHIGRDRGLARSALALPTRPAALTTALTAAWEGRSAPEHADALPAEFVVGRDGALRHARYGRTIWDQPDIEALWQAATRG
jgi:peroxiredoxin